MCFPQDLKQKSEQNKVITLNNSSGEKRTVVLSRLFLGKINEAKIKLNYKNTTSLPCVAMNLQW